MKRWISLLLFASALLLQSTAWGASAGDTDLTFAGTGRQIVGFEPEGLDAAQALVQAPNGSLVMAGTVVQNGQFAIGLAGLDYAGYLNPVLNESGRVSYIPPGVSDLNVAAAAMQADGRIVVAGRAKKGADDAPMVCRFKPDGMVDGAFGSGGCTLLPVADTIGYAQAVIVQTDGKIAVAGRYVYLMSGVSRGFVAQLDSSGHKTGFGTDGVVFEPLSAEGTGSAFNALGQTPDGDLVAAGHLRLDVIDADFLIMKVDQFGTLDTGFSGDGLYRHGFDIGIQNNTDTATSLAVLADGSVVVAGVVATGASPRHGIGLLKFKPDGILALVKVYDPCNGMCDISTDTIAVLPDGRMLLAGTKSGDLSLQDRDFFVWRLFAEGTQDATYGQGIEDYEGMSWVGFDLQNNQSEDTLAGMVLQGERVVVGGRCREATGTGFDFCFSRLDHGLNENFTVWANPGPGGSISPNAQQMVGHSDYAVFSVSPDPGYKIVSGSGCNGGLDGYFYNAGPVTADCTFDVLFGPDISVALSYAASAGGSIDGQAQQSVPYGEDGSAVKALPDVGHHFTQWSDGVVANPRQDVAVTGNIDVVAEFGVNLYAVSVGGIPNGVVEPEGLQWVEHGSVGQILLKPDPGFAIGNASGCGGVLALNVFTTAPVTANCEVTVEFVVSNTMYSLTYTTDGHGSITGESQQSVISGGTGTPVAAVPAPGFKFIGWSDSMTGNPRQDVSVVADVSVEAQFKSVAGPIFADEFED